MKRYSIVLVALAAMILSSCRPAVSPSPTVPPDPIPIPAATPDPGDTATAQPTIEVVKVDSETLELLESEEIPPAVPVHLAQRFNGIEGDIPATVEPPSAPMRVGARDVFHASNQDTSDQFDVAATLRYVTDHLYFWIEDGVIYDENDLERLSLFFENRIYPVSRAFFGSEWSPGIDGDPHIYILYASNLGDRIAGYFGSEDEIHPLARSDSNAHEMFYLNADTVALSSGFTYGTLTHEFQHMIQWNVDQVEDSWVSEGSAELAVHINGLATAPRHPLYTEDPSRSFIDWDPDDSGPHYGAASLFLVYFLDRFGEDLTKAFVRHPANGLRSIDMVFSDAGLTDPLRVGPMEADDAVIDWAVANYLNDAGVADGRFSYRDFSELSKTRQSEILRECFNKPETRKLNQYGVHYVGLVCSGERVLNFDGAVKTSVVPVDPFSGEYAFWSNKGDESNMRLTRAFDFTDVEGPATLSFQTWFDIEDGWDYVYLSASTNGEAWEILNTPSGTDRNPNLNSYGWGYTGNPLRAGWVEETVDLSKYSGKQILLRFEYVTDPVANGEGMLIDDVSIPEIGYFADFEADDGGWEAEGWARIKNVLPQTFELAWISLEDETNVKYIPIGINNTAQIPIDIGEDGSGVLVIVPTTRFTRQPASYTFSFSD